MKIVAGQTCPQCKDGLLIYTGRDKPGPQSTYQRILECMNKKTCQGVFVEDKVLKND